MDNKIVNVLTSFGGMIVGIIFDVCINIPSLPHLGVYAAMTVCVGLILTRIDMGVLTIMTWQDKVKGNNRNYD